MNASRLSIRARITGGSLIIAIVLSIVAGVVIFTQVQRIVAEGQSRVLQSIESPYVDALIESGGSASFESPAQDQLVAVIAPSGVTRINTLPGALSAQVPALLTRPGATSTVSAGDDSFLVRVTGVDTPEGMWHVVTANRNDLEAHVLAQVMWLLIVSIAVINIGFGAASWAIGTAALRPVERLRRGAAALINDHDGEMLPVGPARDEISELAETLNELIAQLRASTERERQIVSNASHEFRTPLAIMQTQLELAQRQAHTLTDMKSDVAAAQRTLVRLSSLATSMLDLSRIDAQAMPGASTTTRLSDELADAADRGRQRVGGRGIVVEYSSSDAGSEAVVAVSDADFARVCDNLVNNALAAIHESGRVVLSLTFTPTEAQLTVSDDAGGMPPEFVPLAFDKFSRADDARAHGGAGLGLSIVAAIVTLAGGEVRLDNRPGNGLTVIADFPIADAAASDVPRS